MYQCIGMRTEKIYASGTESEMHRCLHEKYPSYRKKKPKKVWMVGKDIVVDPVLPELMKIIKVDGVL